VAGFKSESAADFTSESVADLRRNQHPNEPGFHKKGENSTKEGMKTRLRDHSAGRGAASRLDQDAIEGPSPG
jgi:hypothetical protein